MQMNGILTNTQRRTLTITSDTDLNNMITDRICYTAHSFIYSRVAVKYIYF